MGFCETALWKKMYSFFQTVERELESAMNSKPKIPDSETRAQQKIILTLDDEIDRNYDAY